MAAPADMTVRSMRGKFQMNKKLSEDSDKVLQLQGIGWITRKAINLATVVLTITEYEQDGAIHLDITQVASGLSSTQEKRVLNWSERDHKDQLFGSVKGKTRFFNKGEFDRVDAGSEEEKTFLLADKLSNGSPSAFLEGELIQSWVMNVDKSGGWTAEQVWGFEEIDGKKYHTRRVVCKKGPKTERIRLVYDYLGPAGNEDDGLAY